MESFTRRIEAEDESDASEFSAMSDNGFVSSEELRPEVSEFSSTDLLDEVLSTDSAGSASPSLKRMALFEGPVFLRRLNVFEEVEHGGRVTFECKCKAHPMPVSKWYKDDVELVNSERMKIENDLETDGTLRLVISNVRKSDEGAYRCKLENQEGVAATTGYLSVTGNSSSPKSEHAISAPPLLRAITEESNVSQDSEDDATSSSTSLEKILTGEYDVTTLPYSHYLELMKESGALNPEPDTISTPGNNEKKDGGNRTPTEDASSSDDITHPFTDFAYDTSVPFTDDYDVGYLNDPMVTKATNEAETEAEEIACRRKAEVIFGTPLLTDSQTVFVIEGPRREVFADGLLDSHQMSTESHEKLEETENERLTRNQDEEHAKTKGYEVELEVGSAMMEEPFPMERYLQGDFSEDGVLESLDEKTLKETVIAGRIGMPSDWEFAHYTQEPDEGEDFFSAIPDDVDATPRLPVEEAVPEAEMGVSPPTSEPAVPVSENRADKEPLLRGVALLRDDLLGGNAQETSDDAKFINNVNREEATVVPGNSNVPAATSFLRDKITPPVAEENHKGSSNEELEDISRLDSSDRIVMADVQPKDVKAEVKREVSPGSKSKGKAENRFGATNSMPETASISGSVSSGPSPVNWNANSAIPEEGVDAENDKPEVSGSNGDALIQSTDTAGFHFANTKPSVTASSDWSPDVSVSSSLSDLSPGWFLMEQKPAELGMDGAEREPQYAIDWCVEWFRYPSIFYVLLVLTMTLLASATHMNPALLVLVVALGSLVGFILFPLHGAQEI